MAVIDYELGEHSRIIWVNGLNLYTKQHARKVYCITVTVGDYIMENSIKTQLKSN